MWTNCGYCTDGVAIPSWPQTLQQAPQLDRRELVEPLEHVALGDLDEDPCRLAVPLARDEMHPPPAQRLVGVGQDLDEDLPPHVAARQVAHMCRVLAPGKGGRSVHYYFVPPAGGSWARERRSASISLVVMFGASFESRLIRSLVSKKPRRLAPITSSRYWSTASITSNASPRPTSSSCLSRRQMA